MADTEPRILGHPSPIPTTETLFPLQEHWEMEVTGVCVCVCARVRACARARAQYFVHTQERRKDVTVLRINVDINTEPVAQ
jgi:hypothetical protein